MLPTLIALYCSILTLPLVCGRPPIKLQTTTQEPLTFTLNLTQFIHCTNITRDQVSVWKDADESPLITPNNETSNYDEDIWLDCVAEQDVGALVSVSDGTYFEDSDTNVDQESKDILRWKGFRYFVANPDELLLDRDVPLVPGIFGNVFDTACAVCCEGEQGQA
ncbi:putative secreted protein [Wickerhamomyces ciferrii]|uniref:Secreted protein n=1 Tax=Wickerhamomyces ciferrii (strain ATCC 14091 / BCRC 22168 / CBS 111 / JCM 3599 / NBRC 0793 / NRRL Y-1031 F-60-10) TaxID=1206466 RepID=K0KKU8_WICCF|nr:uncharacterized protein BN7_2301 [Wickerhamomyces ciferrii]CCH42757.1 putative secreted protein [Wickerhamomyces ciferrii]